jgi:hypothetical protein
LELSEIKDQVTPFCVAVDYDNTFDSCPETWTKVINTLREAGANVFCVTYRKPTMPVTDFPGEVFYTAGKPKWQHMHDIGQRVNVWIDDWPALIGEDPMRIAFFGLKAN